MMRAPTRPSRLREDWGFTRSNTRRTVATAATRKPVTMLRLRAARTSSCCSIRINQYDQKMLTDLSAPILAGRSDFTFGSRSLRNSRDPLRGGMPLYRWIGNRVTTLAENLLLGTRFSELHSGYKAYNRFFLENIAYHRYSDAFVFDSQMLIDAVLS